MGINSINCDKSKSKSKSYSYPSAPKKQNTLILKHELLL